MNIADFKEHFYQKTLARKYDETLNLVDKGLREKIPPEKLITEGIADTLKKFQKFSDEGYGTVSAFQLLAVGKIAEDSMEKIKPHLEKEKHKQEEKKTVILGTIESDFHALGKKILKLFLDMNDFNVIDLGLDVAPKKFVEEVIKYDADYLFISTMMLHNIIGIKRVGDLLKQKNLTRDLKFYVGGAPFNYNYGLIDKVGADDSAKNIHELMEKLKGEKTEEKSTFRKILRFFKRGD
jgi:methanogenic corrinoid protein MtbC1